MSHDQDATETLGGKELHDLECVVRAGGSRLLRLPGRLETLYLAQMRHQARLTRVLLALLPALICGTSGLWAGSFISLPDPLTAWMQTINLQVIVPSFLALSLVQWRYSQHAAAEWLLMGGFIAVCLLGEWMRFESASYGWRLEPLLITTMPIAVLALARIGLLRMLAFIGAYIVGVSLADQLFQHPDYQRSPSTWLAEWLLLAIMFLAYAHSQYARRKAWCYAALLRAQAVTDPLTGLKNRRALELQYEAVRAALQRHPAPVSLIAVDVDYFKLINDSYGHAYGDGLLTAFAARLAQFARRPLDAAVRLGGDEFILLLPECDAAAAEQIAQNLVQDIRALGLDNRQSPHRVLTTSAGVATCQEALPLWELMRKADAALYRAKSRGRSCVASFEAGMLETPPVPARALRA